jgi:hypothetical protein
MSKISITVVVLGGIVVGCFLAKIRASLRKGAPLGYEDEGGFHFGAPSGRK